MKKENRSKQRLACEDCGEEYNIEDLIPYKYEPSVKLCENCTENRAIEDEEEVYDEY